MGKRARQRRSEEKKAASKFGFSFELLAQIVGRTVEQVKQDATKAFARRWFVAQIEYQRVLAELVESAKNFDIQKFMHEERTELLRTGWEPGVGATKTYVTFTYMERARREVFDAMAAAASDEMQAAMDAEILNEWAA